MKPVLMRVLLLVSSVLFSVSLVECALRIQAYGSIAPLSGEHVLRMPHPTRGWALRPDGVGHQRNLDFDVTVEINDRGLRDVPHAYAKPPGVQRIVVLGDSFMEAYQVPLEESLPRRLEADLGERVGAVEVINLGVGGYGTAQELRQLEEEGLRYQPDLVVLAFYTGNDIQNNSRELEVDTFGAEDPKVWGRPYAHADDLRSPLTWTEPDYARMMAAAEREQSKRAAPLRRAWKLIEPTLLANRLQQLFAQVAARLGAPPADPKAHFGWPFLEHFESPTWDEAWGITRRLILELRDVSRAAGADLVLLIVPAKLQVEESFRDLARAQYPGVVFDETRINRALATFTKEHGILLVDPTPELVASDEAGATTYFQLEDHHWNALGHEIAARRLADAITAAGLLRRPQPSGSSSER
jgi:lysophospholipase L1-like esterase